MFSTSLIKEIQKSTSVGGLTASSFVLLLEQIITTTKKQVAVRFKKRDEGFEFYNMCIDHRENLFGFFPEENEPTSVPGFDVDKKRFIKESLINLSLGRPYCCIGTKKSFEEIKIPTEVIKNTQTYVFQVGEKISIKKTTSLLLGFGYKKKPITKSPGDFSLRGDIVDIYPHHFKNPFRVSYEYDLIGSISVFDPISQLVIQEVKRMRFSEQKNNTQVVDNNSFTHLFSNLLVLSVDKNRSGFLVSPKIKKKEKNLGLIDLQTSGNIKERINRVSKKSKMFKKTFFIGKTNRSLLPYCPEKTIKGCLRMGFFSNDKSIFVCSENDIFPMRKQGGRWTPITKETSLDIGKAFFTQMTPGDYIVHRVFGVGLFLGIKSKTDKRPESIEIEYKNNSRVFVSLDQLSLVHRYVGSKSKPQLSMIGSKKWTSQIKKAKKAAEDVALEILEKYSNKTNKRSFLYVPENDFDNQLKNTFSFVETPDQEKAIQDVLTDMNKETTMDRLICGDVGFGKTEVAIRGVFKSFLSSRLSVFLCPTTILANQHYITCKNRLAGFGVVIELLTRFQSKKEQLEVLKKLNKKKVDVVIGTHRLLSKDVNMPNVGLLVVDEEHRFGVQHKEQIQSLKANLDTLTLTATPIPRTLQQSLVGLRSLSIMSSPPKYRRPIFTSVRYFDWDLIFSKIEFELHRGGQIYFLHNDTKSIPLIVNKLKNKFKKFTITGASGKMSSGELENTVLSFFEGGVDVLVCTTIIESGLDVSNANTIIINNAQNFGLSQLYQIRGRVGRSNKQAHCVLLVPKTKLEKDAFTRLKALEQNTELGSGYNISLKDLEIRGAGSLFGYKQSGHVSSVGFELFCDILNLEIKKTKNISTNFFAPKILCYFVSEINKKYIKDTSFRVGYYYRISRCTSMEELLGIEKELERVFGPLPKETLSLLDISKIRILYTNTPVEKIEVLDGSIAIYIQNNISSFDYDSILIKIGKYKNSAVLNHRFEKTKSEAIRVMFFIKENKKPLPFLFSFVSLFGNNTAS